MTDVLTALPPSPPARRSELDFAISGAGGMYRAAPEAEPDTVAEECERRSVRALAIRGSQLPVVSLLPRLEFLDIAGTPDSAAPIAGARALRGLSFSSGWTGPIKAEWLQSLEWLWVGDGRNADGLAGLLAEHESLHHLGLGLYQGRDLKLLGRLPSLRRVRLVEARRLAGLDGVGAVGGSLAGLDLERCPALSSIGALEEAHGLTYLRLAFCPKVKRVDSLSKLPSLRLLDVQQSSPLETLEPLAGHSGLEVLYLNSVLDGDLDPVALMPRLKIFRAAGAAYNRDKSEFMRAGRIPANDPIFNDLQRLIQG
jgi:hypothetical protein